MSPSTASQSEARTNVSVRLDPDLKRQLLALAEEEHRGLNNMATVLLIEALRARAEATDG